MDNQGKFVFFLICIFSIGFLLRLAGIGYGLPYLSHPDEARIILDTLSMGHRHSLLPERPDYALIYRYFLLFVYGAYYLIGKVLHFFSGPYDFALEFFINPANIYLVSRFISVVLGTVIAIPAYFIGKNIFRSKEIAVISAMFVLFEFQLLQHSQWAIYSIALSFMTLFVFYFMFRLIDNPVRNNFILAGLFCGLTISVQNQGIFLIPSLLLSYVLSFILHKKEFPFQRFFGFTLLSLLFLLVFTLLGNFYWFFVFNKSMLKTMELWGVTRVGFSSAAPYTYNFLSMAWWFIGEIIRQDLLLGIIMVLGLFYAIARHKPYDLVFLTFVFTYLYFTHQWGFRLLHDMLSVLPIICVFAGRFLIKLVRKFSTERHAYLIGGLIVLPLIFQETIVDIKKMQKDTRIQAKEWIEKNIPAGSKIGVDWSVFSVPLNSETPFFLRNPIAKRYYDKSIKPVIGKKYQEYFKSKTTYEMQELMLWTDEPLWPKDMPLDIRQDAHRQIVYRDLYSRFIFKDLDTIINKDKLEYIIITSYAWGMFLFNGDPFKKNLHNPFIKDRQKFNYAHSKNYIDDKRHGYIFYLVKQGRDFYTSLLYNKLSNIRLVQEFDPEFNLGPTIKVYQILRNGK